MATPLRIHRLAQQEIDHTLRWYAKRSLGIAFRLRDLIRDGLKTITETPESWAAFHGAVRAYKIKGFPYLLVYALEESQIFLIAFQHTSRRPGYWNKRWKQSG